MEIKEKLIIEGRTNWKDGFYIKFEAEEKSMKIIKKIAEELGSGYFADNQVIPITFSKYEKWAPIYNSKSKNLDIDIICDDKIIHMIVHKCPSFEFVNKILNKHCDWAQIKYKRGFGPIHSN